MITDKASYDKAKAELKDKQWRKDNLQGSDSFTWHMEQHIALISAALLTYRRAHNIYEVGDQIAYLPKCAPNHNDIYEVREVHQSWCLVVLEDMDHRAIYTNIRHTTDAEREANRRLDQ